MTEGTTIWDIGTDLFKNGALHFVLQAVLSFLIAWIIVRVLQKLIDKAIERGDKRTRTPFAYLFSLLRILIYSFALFGVLDSIKPLSGLGTAILSAGSVATVVIGLAAQTAFGNLISGFFLAINQPFHIGDNISLPEKNIAGTVVEMTMRHTVLLTYENARVIIPNSVLDSVVIEDRAFGQDSFTKRIAFSIAYNTDVDRMKQVITDTVLSTEGVIDTRTEEQKKAGEIPFVIRVDDYLDSGILVSFPVMCRTFGDSFKVTSDIREKLLKEFRKNDIEIPYPKMEVFQK